MQGPNLRKHDVVNLLARRYGLRRLLDIRTPETIFTTGDIDRTWFLVVDRLVCKCPDAGSSGPLTKYETRNPSWGETARAIFAARDGAACYDLLLIDPGDGVAVDATDFESAWHLLQPGGILILHGCSRTRALGDSAGTIETFLDFAVRSIAAQFYTVDAEAGCAVLRKPARGSFARRNADILFLNWMIIREDPERRSAFLDAHAEELLGVISVEEFIARECIAQAAVRHAQAVRPLTARGVAEGKDNAGTNAWLDKRPWIDADDADIEGYLNGLDKHPAYDLGAKLRQWRDLGFVTFEGVVADHLIDAALDDVSEFLANYSNYKIPIEIRGQQLESTDAESFPELETAIKINYLHCFSRAAALMSLTPQACDFLTHVFQEPPAALQSLTFLRGSEQAIHVDYPYVKFQKALAYLAAIWIPLEDIHPDAGPLGYYPGGHKLPVTDFFDWGGGSIVQTTDDRRSPTDFAKYLAQRMREHGIQRQVFCPKRGDMFIWHGNLPHEGTPVQDAVRTRKSYVTHFTSLTNLPDWQFMPLDRRDDHMIKLNGGYCFVDPVYADRRRLPSWKTAI